MSRLLSGLYIVHWSVNLLMLMQPEMGLFWWGLQPMSLRRCEWRVCFREQTTSKPSNHNAPSYGVWSLSGSPEKTFQRMKIQGLQNEGVDCSSGGTRAFVSDFWRFPKFPMKFPEGFANPLMAIYVDWKYLLV
jgi:hypothetical protein